MRRLAGLAVALGLSLAVLGLPTTASAQGLQRDHRADHSARVSSTQSAPFELCFAFDTLSNGSATSAIGYAGQWTDLTGGYANMRARWYSGQSGSFTTRDPAFAATDAAYVYAGGDPVNTIDPSGLCTIHHWNVEGDAGCPGAGSSTAWRAAIVSTENRGCGGIVQTLVNCFSPIRGFEGVANFTVGAVSTFTQVFTLGNVSFSAPFPCLGGWSSDVGNVFGAALTIPFALALLGVPWDADLLGWRNQSSDDVPASTPTGQRGSPMTVPPGTNSPAMIDGISYSGHALDEMQSEGFTPSVVRDAIENGNETVGPSGRVAYYSAANHITVMVAPDAEVVTVSSGNLKPR